MKSILEGVLDSVKYLAGGPTGEGQPSRMFFAHDVDVETAGEPNCLVRVSKADCVQEPRINDLLMIAGVAYQVANVEEEDELWKVTASR